MTSNTLKEGMRPPYLAFTCYQYHQWRKVMAIVHVSLQFGMVLAKLTPVQITQWELSNCRKKKSVPNEWDVTGVFCEVCRLESGYEYTTLLEDWLSIVWATVTLGFNLSCSCHRAVCMDGGWAGWENAGSKTAGTGCVWRWQISGLNQMLFKVIMIRRNRPFVKL